MHLLKITIVVAALTAQPLLAQDEPSPIPKTIWSALWYYFVGNETPPPPAPIRIFPGSPRGLTADARALLAEEQEEDICETPDHIDCTRVPGGWQTPDGVIVHDGD